MILDDVLRWAEARSLDARVSTLAEAACELGHSPAQIDMAFREFLASGIVSCRSISRDHRFAADLPDGTLYLGLRVIRR